MWLLQKIKLKNIKLTSEKIIINFNGNVPQNMEDLMSLPGVGRKTANVVMLEAFNKPQGIAIDTHAKRICNKLGLSNKSTPEQIEQDLLKIIPPKYYKDINHLFYLAWQKYLYSQKSKMFGMSCSNLL